jgi:hypothetical protein
MVLLSIFYPKPCLSFELFPVLLGRWWSIQLNGYPLQLSWICCACLQIAWLWGLRLARSSFGRPKLSYFYLFCQGNCLCVVNTRRNVHFLCHFLHHYSCSFALNTRVFNHQTDSLTSLALEMHDYSSSSVNGGAWSTTRKTSSWCCTWFTFVATASGTTSLSLKHDVYFTRLVPTLIPLIASTNYILTSIFILSPFLFLLEPDVKVSW